MGKAWVPEAKEVQDTTICWQGDGHSLLGRKRRYSVGLFIHRNTITEVHYANFLDQLRIAIREKRQGKPLKGVFLQQDNAGVYTCKVAVDAVERNGYELKPHPSYSPVLAPGDFFLFPNLKKDIRECHFRSDEEVMMSVEEWVNGKDPDVLSSGLMVLEHRWSKYIKLECNYIEKERWISTGNKLGWLLIDSPSYIVLRPLFS